jgi:hypothetical protein
LPADGFPVTTLGHVLSGHDVSRRRFSRDSASRSGLSRHLEGWQIGVLAVGMAIVTAALVVPREAEPVDLPAPRVDHAEQRRVLEEDRKLAARYTDELLPFEVRRLGERLRQLGLEETRGALDARDVEELRREAREVHERHGSEALLGLVALQSSLFASALRRWEASGVPDDELAELGGAFAHRTAQTGLMRSGRLRLDPGHRRVVFRMRWLHLTGLVGAPGLRPSLDDWRTHLGLVLRHPRWYGADTGDQRLQAVARLERLDPEFPAELARGVIEFRRGSYPDAARSFERHLDRSPRGRWALRARHHWLAALERIGGTGDESLVP